MKGEQKKEIDPEEEISEEESLEIENRLDDAQVDDAQVGDTQVDDTPADPDASTPDESAETDADGVIAEAEEITIESLTEQIEALKASVAESLDNAVRAQAELDNVRKRAARDVQNAHKYALDKFVNELLPVLDSMELGINASENVEDVSSLREGMDLTMKLFSSSLEKSGVSPVAPQNGDKFNPDQHEAVTVQEVEDVESGSIVATLQKGYELNGRLIRPAMVIVAK